jgi:hypothetical protein
VAVSRIISLPAARLIIHVLIDCWSAFFMLMFSDFEMAMTLIDEGLMGLKFDSVEHVSSRQACVAFYYSAFQTFFRIPLTLYVYAHKYIEKSMYAYR